MNHFKAISWLKAVDNTHTRCVKVAYLGINTIVYDCRVLRGKFPVTAMDRINTQ